MQYLTGKFLPGRLCIKMASGSYSGGRMKAVIQSSRDEGGFSKRQNFNSTSDDHSRDSRSNPHDLDTTQLYLNVTNLKLSCKKLDNLRKEIERKKKKIAKKEKKNKRQLEESENFKKKKAVYRELYSEILVERATVNSLFDTSRRPPDDNKENQNSRAVASERQRPKSRPPLPQLDKEECEKCRGKNTNIWKLEADIKKYKKDIEHLQKDVSKLSGETDQERRDKQDNNRDLQHRIAELETQIAKERSEKEDALRRLSSMASAKLRDNNPNIADLSDPNRPTKIAEKLSEIYDNEWTDAFDQLEKSYSKMEKDNAQLLLDVLIEVHQQCNNLSGNILNNIIAPLQPTDIPPEVSKNLKDALKMLTPYKMNAVAKEIKSKLPSRFTNGVHLFQNPKDPFYIYVDKCVDACLHMSVQDPPMYLSADPNKDGLFSNALYRAYTKSGKYEVFIVWPVLYLHKNGPMMSKGVAQGTDDKTIIQNSYSQQHQLPIQSQNVVRRQHENQHRPQQHQQQYQQDRYQHGGMQTSYGSSANHRQRQHPSHYLAQGYSNPQFSITYHPRISTTSQITDF